MLVYDEEEPQEATEHQEVPVAQTWQQLFLILHSAGFENKITYSYKSSVIIRNFAVGCDDHQKGCEYPRCEGYSLDGGYGTNTNP